MRARALAAAMVGLSLMLASSMGHSEMFAKNETRFDWLAGDSAPREYPMRVLGGTFYYHDAKSGLYVPDSAVLRPGWGNVSSTHVVGEDVKPLPDRLDIRFFSFTENKMYRGSFDLPYEKILQWFRAGVAQNRDTVRDPDEPTFNRIAVGIAPGGAVAVWVAGQEWREVFFGQAEPYEDVLLSPMRREIKPDERDDYVERNLKHSLTPEQLAELKQKGPPIGRWTEYRKQYRWVPTFAAAGGSKYADVSFYNGESYRLYQERNEQTAKESRTVPQLMSYSYQASGPAASYPYTVRFNEAEIYAAFQRLGANDELVHIEMNPKLPKDQTTVRLYNRKESIQLTRCLVN